MSQLEYTGKDMTLTWNSVTFEGLTRVALTTEDGPDAEQIDVTVSGDTAYTYLTDPLGAKGDDKSSLVVTCWASTASYADSKNTAHALNSAQTGTFDTSTTTNANEWECTTLELTKRVTRIPWAGYATCEMTFEANDLGTWDSPA